MDKNKKCSSCNTKLDKDNYKKDRTVCKDCYNKKKRKNINNNTLIRNQPPKTDNFNENNSDRSTILFRPSFSGKFYLMLKFLSRILNRDIHIITKSPPDSTQTQESKLKK